VTKEFIQVRPGNGYLIHAVPADAERLDLGAFKAFWVNGRVLCGKIKTYDAQRMPNLKIQFDRTVPLYGAKPLPFTLEELRREDMPPFCTKCSDRVMQASG